MVRNDLRKCGYAAILLTAVVVLAATLGIRYGLLENGLLPRDCSAGGAPALACGFKWGLVQSFLHQRLGWASLVFGVAAFAFSARRLAWVGWLLGLAGLVLYSFDPAAVGALLALLVLVRPASGQGRDEDGLGEGEAGQQPADRLRVRRLR